MELEHIISLIDRVSASELTNFYYEEGNLKISMKKKRQEVLVQGVPEIVKIPDMAQTRETEKTGRAETTFAGNQMKAPLVGIFYNAPAPDCEPFVKLGDVVKKGQTLGIIEAMKLMNEIESEYDGTVEAILVENEQLVEYGQPLFVIR